MNKSVLTNGHSGEATGPSGQAAGHSGQAIVEFLLTLMLVIGVVFALSAAFKDQTGHLWKQFACELSAPCPTCHSDPATAANMSQPGFKKANCK